VKKSPKPRDLARMARAIVDQSYVPWTLTQGAELLD